MKYDVQYKIGNLNFTGWLTDVVYSDETLRGTPGMTYTFQVRIRDKAGNQSNWVQSSVVEISKVTKYYTFGSQRVAMRQGNQVYYLHGDHLGSTSLTTDQAGAAIAQARYLPYGEERWTNGASPTDFAFTSQRNEMGFGLYDYNARYYSPYLGRFISPDTLIPDPANSQTWNRYAYANNNPIRYNDPTGHCADPVSGTMCAAAAFGPPGWVVAGVIGITALTIVTIQLAPDIADAIGDITAPPTVPTDQEGFSLEEMPDPLAPERPTLEVAGPTVEAFPLEPETFGLDFPSEHPPAFGDNVLQSTYRGGRYGQLPGGPGIERHHMPADKVSPFPTLEGPAIEMDRLDHYDTASWGRAGAAYRGIQKDLIDQGRLDDAIQMDIDDIQSKFGDKYDQAILEMIDKLP